ncbi:hypothetical protein BKG68_04315 [Mycobacteroides saopaulense]|uniref:HEPN domain-containing protein n=1 Tax=Mycobacteroides saopaulense TaxID=1578165 RepID=A0ABX3C643_9MYCO|nr:hypothetical protein BKG68_04315 [Mycobacteroides saopaulense]OHU13900.1 hypothetical protein BKG73_04325 [Mycobacteroides saopaulense]
MVVIPESIVDDLSPYAMALFSSDLDVAARSIEASKRFSAAKYFLICLSIELAIKSTLLNLKIPRSQLKSAGHNLGKLLDEFTKHVEPQFITAAEGGLIRQMVGFYDYDKEFGNSKGLVYFETNMKSQALQAYKGLPDIKKLEKVHDKLQNYLKENNYYL